MNTSQPPKWAIRFLEWFCPDELIEGVLGDIVEQYELDLESMTISRANMRFVLNIIRFFHPSIIFRNHFTINFINISMLKSHLLVAFRSMKKYKFYAAINILGLACAIAFVFLSFLFIQNELSIDQFHSQKENIHRIYHEITKVENGELVSLSAVTAVPLSRDLKAEVPAIKQFTRHGSSSGTVRQEDQPFDELLTYVDPAFLEIFDFPLFQGDVKTALSQPSSVVISKEKAEKYFGNKNPIGETLVIEANDTLVNYQVTGVIDAKNAASSIQFGILLPFEQFKLVVPPSFMDSYNYNLVENYVLVTGNQTKAEMEATMTEAIKKVSDGKETQTKIGLQPLATIHLEDEVVGNAEYTSPKKLYIMMGLTVLVMIIAAINFITLSTSHGLNRLKEIGMRKTLGALKSHLTNQLIFEAIAITMIAGAIGMGLAYIASPTFIDLVESTMIFSINVWNVLFLFAIIVLIGIINGSFQSLILVKYQVSEALKGNLFTGSNLSWLNQGLIVLQFSLSVLLIIGAVSIRNQMNYIQNKDLGYDEERLLEISMGTAGDKEAANALLERFRATSMKDSRILGVSACMNSSREAWTELTFLQVDGTSEKIFYNQVDPTYLKTMGIEIIEGTNFPPQAGKEFNGILVNESLVKYFGWEDPLEQQIPGKNFSGSHRILGVVKDFHFSSLHQQIGPLILAVSDENSVASGVTGLSTYVWPPNLYQLQVRFSPGEIEPVIKHVENVWNEVNPNKEFSYHFVDEVLEAQYAEEKRWAKIINLGSLFAIAIAWLGLLGLMRLSIQKRTKEIGIRKVLGSSTSGIVLLLSRRFLLLVSIGIIIACPIGWILMDQWLQSFTYRIDMNIFWFILAGLGVLVITLFSVGLQSLRTARANPVDALKFE